MSTDECCVKRGARLQILREWLDQYHNEDDLRVHESAASSGWVQLWKAFLDDYPEAADWFDANGVPKT